MTDSDLLFLRAALLLAERGMNSTSPNPRVGCLIVKDGVVLGRGWHVRAGEGHAEVNALADAGAVDVQGATAYVTLEPCAFEGRTPPCSQALINAGVGRVVAALTDPHPKVAGQGFADLRAAGLVVDVVELPEARAVVEGYLSRVSRARPFVRIKMAISIDGRTAMASGESQWITSEESRADVQNWRARSCAVVTGSQTVLDDDPAMNVRIESAAVDGQIRQPLRVILDSRLRVPPDARILEPPGETLIVHSVPTPSDPGAAALLHLPDESASGRVSLPDLFKALGERKCNEVLVEAGPTLAGAVLESGLWDELLLYVAPRLLGSDGRPLAALPLARMADAIEATIVDQVELAGDMRVRLRPASS
jgi:diaminohydroxyphosphoribosylaminopyrimidine deaminase/5-amino-6-(5-phosphoribosylamino)uracil reductase